MFQIFKIGSDFHTNLVEGALLRTRAHDTVYGAYVYEYRIKDGFVYLSIMNRKIHEVTYECPSILPWVTKKRLTYLLDSYCRGGNWRQVLNNTSGKIFQSADNELFASWSKIANSTSFGTMFFYEEKYRLVT